jgi:hypothetical protein
LSTIDIDRDAAHDAAQNELNKPIYPRASVSDRFTDWLNDLLYRIAAEGSSFPGGWLALSVLFVVLVIGVVVAIRVARGTMRTNRGADYSLFAGHDLSAAEHRARAEQAAAAGDWTAAIRHRLRAVARQLEETAVLDPNPGRTATELARDAGAALPGLRGELSRAAEAFNDVTYGERPGTEAAYRIVAELDEHLRSHSPATMTDAGAPAVTDGWAGVR